MFEKLGRARYVVPVAIVLVMSCFLSLMFYPMAHIQMENLPFAVLNLDEGVKTSQGTLNVGQTMVDGLTSEADNEASEEDDSSTPIAWTCLTSEDELGEALEDNEYYGALVIPAGYTQATLATQQAKEQANDEQDAGTDACADAQETASLTVYLDNAKSPLVATMMQSSIASMFSQQGLSVDVQVIHAGSTSSSSSTTSLSGGSMSLSMSVTPVYILSMLGSIMMVNALGVKRGASRKERAQGIARQAVYAVGLSLLISMAQTVVLTCVAGVEAPATVVLFYWLVSACIMLFLLGAANIAMPLGYLCGMLMQGLCIMCAMYPREMLPEFWQDWVYPWAPHRFIGEGVRQVLYMGSSAWNEGTQALAVFALVGIALLVIAVVVPRDGSSDQRSKGLRHSKAMEAAAV